MTESTQPTPTPPPAPGPAEAAAALESVRAARSSMGLGLELPRGYDAVYGAAVGVCVAAAGVWGAASTANDAWFALLAALAMWGAAGALFVWLVKRFRAVNGAWVSGYRPRRARWAAIGVGALFVVLFSAAWSAGAADRWWLVTAYVVAADLGALALSRLWMRLYRADVAADLS